MLSLSIISKLDTDLPDLMGGSETEICIFATGLRYKLCGRYNGVQSVTFSMVCMFIIWEKVGLVGFQINFSCNKIKYNEGKIQKVIYVFFFM